jgi:S1-C subfamily serine protease
MSTDETSDETTAITVLQRETILPSSDRGRLAAIIATCSMAGLAGGMALSMLAESQRVADQLRRDQLKASMRLEDEQAARMPVTWLGLTITEEHADRCDGVRVTEVVSGSPAQRAGFQVGDLVETFGGSAICDQDHLITVVRYSSIGATPEIGVRRGAEAFVLSPKLGVMPPRFRQ